MKLKFTKFNIFNIFLCTATFCFGLYALSNQYLFTANPQETQSPIFFYIIFSLCLISFGFFVGTNIFKKNYKFSKIILIVSIFLFVVGFINLLTIKENTIISIVKGETINQYEYSFSINNRIRYIFSYLILILMFYCTVDVVPKVFKDFDILYFYSILFILTTIVLAIISYFIENVKYIEFIKNIASDNPYASTVKSLFYHRNSYGVTLFCAICSSLYLHHEDKKFYWFIFDGFFFINMIFTLCKTGLILSILLNVSYLIARFVLTYKENRKRNLIAFISIIGTFVALIVMAVIILSMKGKLSSLLDSLFSKDIFRTVEARFELCKTSIDIVKSTNVLVGAGYKVFGDLLHIISSEHNYFSHNGIVELLGQGGVVLLVCAILIVIYYLYNNLRLLKINKNEAIFGYIIFTVCFIYTMFESGSIIFPSTLEYTFISFLIFVPLLQKYPFEI